MKHLIARMVMVALVTGGFSAVAAARTPIIIIEKSSLPIIIFEKIKSWINPIIIIERQ